MSQGGEACTVEMANLWSGHCAFQNYYGPTEATGFVTWKAFKPGETALTIGQTVRESITVVLDEDHNEVAPGVVGELCFGGLCLSRGYWEDEEKTKESFFNHPKYGRLYLSGDLGCIDAAGSEGGAPGDILIRGRRDEQVKIRGVRIELQEVEQVLLEHPCASQAVRSEHVLCARIHNQSWRLARAPARRRDWDMPRPALTRICSASAQRVACSQACVVYQDSMVAFVVPGEGKTVDIDGLIELAKSKVATQAVPEMVIPLKKMPRTASDKVDKRELVRPIDSTDKGYWHARADHSMCEVALNQLEPVLGAWVVESPVNGKQLPGSHMPAPSLLHACTLLTVACVLFGCCRQERGVRRRAQQGRVALCEEGAATLPRDEGARREHWRIRRMCGQVAQGV